MKFSFTILLLLFCSACFSQEKPVLWKVTSQKLSDTTYLVTISGATKGGWYVYAESDLQNNLDGIRLKSENNGVVFEDLSFDKDPKTIHDQIFEKDEKVVDGNFELKQKVVIRDGIPNSLEIVIEAYAANGKEFLPINETVELSIGDQIKESSDQLKLSSIDLMNPVSSCGHDLVKETGLLAVFFLGLIGGLLALLTPCVFPMIPVTVSFFMGKSKTKNQAVRSGLLYGFFIFLIYLLASSPFHLIKGIDKNIFNSIATNAWVNVAFFIIFIAFALSFFGLFEITLPGAVATKADSKSNLVSASGIFFMALTLAIVSFSCTGVILGVLLANVAASGPWALTAGMSGFGLALALPFSFFAMFPNLLKKLPKSGSWLETVKKSLAFVELALAFKFLSNADLVEHWGLLKREVFIAIWALISLVLAFYLLGFFGKKIVVSGLQNADRIRYQKPKLSKWRIVFGIVVLLFALYLIPGITQSKYANLKLLSGFAPPLSYSVYGKDNIKGKGVEPVVVNDYQKALQIAKEQNKPLLIDFTGWACVNCRKMEEHVWTKKAVKDLINGSYILVSLYVDDRKDLGQGRFSYKTVDGERKRIKTVGDKWATFQAENFNQVTQPLYVILSPDEKLLNHPVGYTPDEHEYEDWLECGLNAFEKAKNMAVRK